MMLLGISGLGLGDYASCNAACQANYDPTSDAFYACNDACVNADSAAASTANSASSPTGSSGSPQNNQTAWWSTALTSLVKGATQAVVGTPGACPPGSVGTYPACQCLPGSPGVYPTCMTPAQPFYETPFGIAVIIGVLGFGAYMISRR